MKKHITIKNLSFYMIMKFYISKLILKLINQIRLLLVDLLALAKVISELLTGLNLPSFGQI